jgi:hypothetical protein
VFKHHIDLEQWGTVWLRGLKGFDKTWTIPDDNHCYYYDNYNYDDAEEEDMENEEEVQEEVEDKGNENEEGKEKYNDDDDVEEEEEDDDERDEEDNEEGGVPNKDCEWNSVDDNVLNIEDGYETCYSNISFLGFHPYKEVVFLALSRFTGVAYHLNRQKFSIWVTSAQRIIIEIILMACTSHFHTPLA